METLDCQQDGGVPGSVAESESAHLQAQTDPNSAPTLAQVNPAWAAGGAPESWPCGFCFLAVDLEFPISWFSAILLI